MAVQPNTLPVCDYRRLVARKVCVRTNVCAWRAPDFMTRLEVNADNVAAIGCDENFTHDVDALNFLCLPDDPPGANVNSLESVIMVCDNIASNHERRIHPGILPGLPPDFLAR